MPRCVSRIAHRPADCRLRDTAGTRAGEAGYGGRRVARAGA